MSGPEGGSRSNKDGLELADDASIVSGVDRVLQMNSGGGEVCFRVDGALVGEAEWLEAFRGVRGRAQVRVSLALDVPRDEADEVMAHLRERLAGLGVEPVALYWEE
jgi:hypothetical protein